MESKKRKLNKGKFVRTLLVATLAIYFCVVFIKLYHADQKSTIVF